MKKLMNFDYDQLIQRNKEAAMEKFGVRIDSNRNIVGTDYYFDSCWRLCKRSESNDKR